MACVACFFGGRYWHLAGDYWNRMAVPPADHKMQILAGRSGIINSSFRVSRVEADDATIASVSPLTLDSFSVAAHRAGKTTVRMWGPAPSDTRTLEIEVRLP
jgi:Flp pilus assembly secretin CpaC